MKIWYSEQILRAIWLARSSGTQKNFQLTFLGKNAYFTVHKPTFKKARLWKGGGMFKFHRNKPPSRLCRVLRSPLDWGKNKWRIFFSRSLWPPLVIIFQAFVSSIFKKQLEAKKYLTAPQKL